MKNKVFKNWLIENINNLLKSASDDLVPKDNFL